MALNFIPFKLADIHEKFPARLSTAHIEALAELSRHDFCKMYWVNATAGFLSQQCIVGDGELDSNVAINRWAVLASSPTCSLLREDSTCGDLTLDYQLRVVYEALLSEEPTQKEAKAFAFHVGVEGPQKDYLSEQMRQLLRGVVGADAEMEVYSTSAIHWDKEARIEILNIQGVWSCRVTYVATLECESTLGTMEAALRSVFTNIIGFAARCVLHPAPENAGPKQLAFREKAKELMMEIHKTTQHLGFAVSNLSASDEGEEDGSQPTTH